MHWYACQVKWLQDESLAHTVLNLIIGAMHLYTLTPATTYPSLETLQRILIN